MKGRFRITDCGGGEISRFVGICVDRTVEGFYRLHQQPYLDEVIVRLGLDDAKHARYPERGGSKAKLKPLEDELTPQQNRNSWMQSLIARRWELSFTLHVQPGLTLLMLQAK